MKRIILIVITIAFCGCNPILKTSFWGFHLDKSYSSEEIVSTIGTQGDFIEFKNNDIRYENITFHGINWDEAEFSLSNDGVLERVSFSKYYDSQKECREQLYSLKTEYDKAYGKPLFMHIQGESKEKPSPIPSERFTYSDTRSRKKGGSLTLEAEYFKQYPYILYKLSLTFYENRSFREKIEAIL